MSMTMITGLIGVAMFILFVGFLVVWVPAPPLILIVLGVTALLVYDFISELRAERNSGQ